MADVEEKVEISEIEPTGDGANDAAALAAKKKKQKQKEKEKAKAKEEKEKAEKKKKQTTGDLIKKLREEQLAEQEKLRKKQEDEEKRLEELEQQRLQKAKEEQEKKERKKQKEKERLKRLKDEGKFLKPQQKAKHAKGQKMVEILKTQGVVFGQTAKKKPEKVAGNSDDVTTEQNGGLEKEKDISPDIEIIDFVDENEDKVSDIIDSWDQVDIDEGKNKTRETRDHKSPRLDEDDNNADDEESSSNERSKAEEIDDNVSLPGNVAERQTKPELQKSDSSVDVGQKKEKESVSDRIKRRQQEALAGRTTDVLRSPVICVLGHVDTGKTKILDKIRRTHVQDSEAGGITQQIGATMVPADVIKEQAKMVKDVGVVYLKIKNPFDPDTLKLPGFLIIDTPGHESFTNLRSRGSSLCDIAILVVDIMHGLEPQTIESLNMLKKRKTPFVIALNKIDRLYEWKQNPHKDVRNVIKSQQPNAKIEFDAKLNETKVQFAEQGLNVALFWENPDPSEYISIIPTSAHSGDGMGNLMATVAQHAQTLYSERLAYSDNLQCSVLEVKALPGLGTTIDVILVNGCLHVGDTMLVAGMEGPIVTPIRELLMPQPLREMRVKNPYQHYKELRGAQGVKILAKDLDKALAGLPLFVAQQEDEIDHFKQELEEILENTLHSIKLSEKGVYVQASTLGSLEALLEFLRTQKIPYSGINIGPVHKKDVMRASTMLEHDAQWAVILAFDVKVERDAEVMADDLGVRVFQADIIYHLQDAFVKYREELRLKKRQEVAHLAIFPCKIRILQQHVFKTRDPIVVGVIIEDGVLKVGTPLCVPSKENLYIGSVSSIEANHKPLEMAKKGQEVCIKIENTTGEAPKMYDRHFNYEDALVSRITRETIDVCKEYYREDLAKSDWQLIVELKKNFKIL